MIKNSIILNDVYIGDNTYIENCIVESRDTIRANTRHVGENDIKIVIEKEVRHLGIKTQWKEEKGAKTSMQITDVRVRKVAKEGKLKAVVSITMDEEFVVHDIKVIEGEKGLFIAMPSKKTADGEYRDIAHPINSETRERIQSIILERYEVALQEQDAEE